MQDDPHAKVKLELLRCRRTGQMFSAKEHAVCPYCSADAATIAESGDYTRFCEYQPGQDPIHFGFPEAMTRNTRG